MAAPRRHRAHPSVSEAETAHDARLLMDLLEHKVGVATLFGHVQIPVDMGNLGLNHIAGLVGILDSCGRELGKLAVLEHHAVAGCVDERDDIGSNIGTGFAHADYDR